jgi:uncharacterized protein (TIGR03435 family)
MGDQNALSSWQFPSTALILVAMRALPLLTLIALSGSVAFPQAPTTPSAFEVASVRPCQRPVGPDYNNQLTYSPSGITARNVTVKRLLAEAYHLQLNQVLGPGWIGQNEYDIDARSAGVVTRDQIAQMLKTLLADRFKLTRHSENREMRAYVLKVAKSGAKIHPVSGTEAVSAAPGFHFHGDMREFADLLSVQLSIPAAVNPAEPVRASTSPIPVLDQTGLLGIFDFSVDIHPELGTDMFTLWQRTLEDQMALRIESRKGSLPVLVVDEAAIVPTEN